MLNLRQIKRGLLGSEVSQKLKSLVAVPIGLRLFLIGFAPNVANPIKYTSTCPDTPLKTGKLQLGLQRYFFAGITHMSDAESVLFVVASNVVSAGEEVMPLDGFLRSGYARTSTRQTHCRWHNQDREPRTAVSTETVQ